MANKDNKTNFTAKKTSDDHVRLFQLHNQLDLDHSADSTWTKKARSRKSTRLELGICRPWISASVSACDRVNTNICFAKMIDNIKQQKKKHENLTEKKSVKKFCSIIPAHTVTDIKNGRGFFPRKNGHLFGIFCKSVRQTRCLPTMSGPIQMITKSAKT